MGEASKIEWTDNTQNFWWGCEKVSPGCKFCYAEALSTRYDKKSKLWRGDRRRTKDWSGPRRWNKRARASGIRERVFTNSMADFFEDHPSLGPWRSEAWDLIRECDWLDWQILTKRPENIAEMLPGDWGAGWPNVWLGTSIENQDYDWRATKLIEVPAVVRFLSFEPLLGPIDLAYSCFNGADSLGSMPGIHWAIIGGESGKGARACAVQWIRDLIAQCRAASVACFVKQLGAFPMNVRARLNDKKGGNMSEWPEDLRIRQFPADASFTPAA